MKIIGKYCLLFVLCNPCAHTHCAIKYLSHYSDDENFLLLLEMAATIISDNYKSCIMDFVLARGKNTTTEKCIKDKQKKKERNGKLSCKREKVIGVEMENFVSYQFHARVEMKISKGDSIFQLKMTQKIPINLILTEIYHFANIKIVIKNRFENRSIIKKLPHLRSLIFN